MSKKVQLQIPEGAKKVLLHSCCAPCSTAIIECLLDNNIRPTIFYHNPNIFPKEEYEIRKAENIRYAESLGLDFIDADYNHKYWLESMKGMEDEPERGSRCLNCFKQRMLATAKYASDNNFPIITTTLASSRWKSLEQIFEAGRYATSIYPTVIFWEQNWRKHGLSERRNQIIKEYNFYNQLYCGCEFSLRDSNKWRKANNKPLIETNK